MTSKNTGFEVRRLVTHHLSLVTALLERETGIEPATNSLEGCDSTIELLPPVISVASDELLASFRRTSCCSSLVTYHSSLLSDRRRILSQFARGQLERGAAEPIVKQRVQVVLLRGRARRLNS